MRDAIGFVAEKGYSRIIYVSPPLSYRGEENIYEVEERLSGFREGAKLHGIEEVVIREKHFGDLLSSALRASAKRTAIVCSSDIYALEALRHLFSLGIEVPENVGLVGFDDIDILSYIRPALTTISYPIEELCGQAFSLLMRLMGGEANVESPPLVETRLISRESL